MIGDCEDAAGDEPFDDFFRTDFPRLVKLLIRMGYEWEAANDSAEEAMVAVYQKWETLRHPQAYARTAAIHAACNQARRDRERLDRSIRGGWLPPDPVDPFAAIDDRLDGAATLLTLMAKLPDQQRSVLALHLDGFTNTEIAHDLDMLPATVGSNLRHAKQRLRTELMPTDIRHTELRPAGERSIEAIEGDGPHDVS